MCYPNHRSDRKFVHFKTIFGPRGQRTLNSVKNTPLVQADMAEPAFFGLSAKSAVQIIGQIGNPEVLSRFLVHRRFPLRRASISGELVTNEAIFPLSPHAKWGTVGRSKCGPLSAFK